MRTLVSLEQRFTRTPDGAVWTQSPYIYHFWTRYLEIFDEVRVVARLQDVAQPESDWIRADGECVSFASVPYYVGPRQYVTRAWAVRRAVRQAVHEYDALIFRIPSQLANTVIPALQRRNRPYSLHVVGDPYDVFAPEVMRHPLRPFFRWWFARQQRRFAVGACAVNYVTDKTLQRRYPAAPTALSIHFSDVELPDQAFIVFPRHYLQKPHFTLITVASLAQLYKAPDILIAAVSECLRQGLDLHLVMIGDGQYRSQLEVQAAALGLGERVRFLGQLPAGEAVQAHLDRADLFVLPSRTEGLPRAVIEAMARGLPCIGSTVGGIPELLPPEDLVPSGDIAALARKIAEVLGDTERLEHMSARNLQNARRYSDRILRERRVEFYQYVKDKTQAWINEGSG